MRWRACAVLISTLAAFVVTGCTVGDDTRADLEAARRFQAYPLYWLGDRFEKWPLTHVDVENVPYALFVYGDCKASGDSGCAPPLQLQISAICDHLPELTSNPVWRHRRVRGAPVGSAPDGAPVLFTRRVQVKVYRGQGSDPGVELRALRSLNGLAPVIAQVGPIPGPASGVLEGTSACPG